MTSSSSSSGVGFTGLLTTVLITLKLTKVISISWFLCLLPVIINFAIVLIVLGVVFAIALLKK